MRPPAWFRPAEPDFPALQHAFPAKSVLHRTAESCAVPVAPAASRSRYSHRACWFSRPVQPFASLLRQVPDSRCLLFWSAAHSKRFWAAEWIRPRFQGHICLLPELPVRLLLPEPMFLHSGKHIRRSCSDNCRIGKRNLNHSAFCYDLLRDWYIPFGNHNPHSTPSRTSGGSRCRLPLWAFSLSVSSWQYPMCLGRW